MVMCKMFASSEKIVWNCSVFIIDISTDGDKSQSAEASLAHHVLVCALHELGCLVQSLGTSSAPLITEPAAGILRRCGAYLFVVIAQYFLS